MVSPVLVPVSLLGAGLPGADIGSQNVGLFNEEPTLTEDFGSTLRLQSASDS